jgi:hypothetical protein
MLQHESYHETPMKDYYDGREQPVLAVRDFPDPPLHLVASRPRVEATRIYPETAESVMDAYLHNCVERAECGIVPLDPPKLSNYERLNTLDALRRLADLVGWQQLYTNLRNLAYLDGVEVK